MASDARDEDRLFVKEGFKHYRRTYSRAEVRWGLACGAALAGILGWVVWKGKQPDPSLIPDETTLMKGGATVTVRPPEAPPAAARSSAEPAADRGPLPKALAGGGFREDKVAVFDAENLYVKINGRADFFKAFGFKKLYSALLISEKDPSVTIDFEMYDLARQANALGAYGGERGAEVKPVVDEAGLHHFDRNALYGARGPYYLRVIGSDESPAVKEKLAGILEAVRAGIPGEPLPWSFAFFVGGLGMDPGAISYFAEGAFSFSFATDVWSARPGGRDSDLELFICALGTPAAAKQRATQFGKGFLELGQPAGKAGGVAFVKDQFLSTLSGVVQVDRWVVGVRGAASQEAALKDLDRLREALVQLPPDVKERARPAAKKKAEGDSYE